MKQLFVVAIALLCAAPASFAQQQKPVKKDTTQHKTYTCPMHSEVTSDKPGKCPKCGMNLVEKKVPAKGRTKKDTSAMKM
jgi:hypothetical protein